MIAQDLKAPSIPVVDPSADTRLALPVPVKKWVIGSLVNSICNSVNNYP